MQARSGDPAGDGTPGPDGLSRGWWADAADVIAVADHLGLDSFDVLAHSGVGGMTLAAATTWFSDIPADVVRRIDETRLPPTLVLGGAEDILSGVEPVRAYAKALGAQFRLVEGCGHYPWVEQPATFLDALSGWLRAR